MGSMVIESTAPIFRIIGVGNRGLSGIVYRIKVARVCSKQSRRNAWGAGFGKIADTEFHSRKIKWQPPISKNRDSQQSRWPRTGLWFEPQGYLQPFRTRSAGRFFLAAWESIRLCLLSDGSMI
jgi:hypothetical protein